MRSSCNLKITSTGGALGAFVEGLDLSKVLSEAIVQNIQRAFWQYSVLVFRGQALSEKDQVSFSRYLCDPRPHPTNLENIGALPEICIISNVIEGGKPVGALGCGEVAFHADLAFRAELGTVSILYAKEAPDDSGLTSWSSGMLAYKALDGATREKLSRVSIIYSHSKKEYLSENPAIHPLIISHPESQLPSMYFSSGHALRVEGMSQSASDDLIGWLRLYTTKSDFVWTHRWKPGDLIVWDNRTTQHRRSEVESTKRRFMRRTQAVGFLVPNSSGFKPG